MAEGYSMTAAERAAKTLLDEHADVIREAVATVVAQLMEPEISAEIGAARGEVPPDRLTHRNGYRPRLWETRVGELELLVPRKRSGEAFFPPSSSRAGAASRRSWRSSWRPTSTGSAPARSTGSSSSSVSAA